MYLQCTACLHCPTSGKSLFFLFSFFGARSGVCMKIHMRHSKWRSGGDEVTLSNCTLSRARCTFVKTQTRHSQVDTEVDELTLNNVLCHGLRVSLSRHRQDVHGKMKR